jgi:hypothetical protein
VRVEDGDLPGDEAVLAVASDPPLDGARRQPDPFTEVVQGASGVVLEEVQELGVDLVQAKRQRFGHARLLRSGAKILNRFDRVFD